MIHRRTPIQWDVAFTWGLLFVFCLASWWVAIKTIIHCEVLCDWYSI